MDSEQQATVAKPEWEAGLRSKDGLAIGQPTSLIHDHPSEDVRSAAIRLLDALCMWERNTGRHHVLIIKDSIGCEYRVLDNAPVPGDVSDLHLLECFRSLAQDG